MKRVLAIALSALLTTTVSFAGHVLGLETAWQTKVDTTVLQAASAGRTEFIVYLQAKADLAPAADLGTKAAKGAFVFDALTTTARTSQAPVVTLLRDMGADYQQFWIANSIVVTAGMATIQAVAERSDVRAIYPVGSGELDRPVDLPGGTEAVAVTSTVGPSIDYVRADEAWALGYRGQGAVVAGADTGVRWTHNVLKSHYRGWEAATGTADHDYNWHNAAGPNVACTADESQPCDDDGHGTHTVGTIVGDDGLGNQVGMAPGATWIACRNMNNGVGVVPTYMDCMQWFIAPTDMTDSNPDPAKAPDVVNNSWGCVEVCAPPLLKDMIDASRAAGIFYVVSAGNDNQFFLGVTTACNTINFPLAVYDAAFTVGATNATNDSIASFSSLGPVADNPAEGIAYRKPDIVAPGVGIRSAVATSDNSFGNKSGTSMSGPHVAGLVALIISANPSLRGHVDTIEDVIRRSAKPLTSTKGCGGDTSTDVPNNVFGWGRIDALAAVQLALTTEPGPTFTRSLVGLPAQLVAVQKETLTQSHPTTDYTGGATRTGSTTWRVIKDTGNCCENHLGMSSGGRLFDIGGSFINYSDDRGLSWTSVRPPEPLVNGEGSMAMAPNGDVIGVTWDAYSADHVLAYKYNAETGQWQTLTNVLHHPVYDRPWLSVVPGPFTDATGKVVPYISIMQGGTGIKDPMFVSTDGLAYVEPSSLNLGSLSNSQVTRYFPITADASFDWIQPIRSSPVTGMGAGYAVANGGYLLDPEAREWAPWRLPGNVQPPTYIQVDSGGRIHHVRAVGSTGLEYRISSDAGQTWATATFPLPFQPDEARLSDFKVNRAVGIGAIAVRLNSQDWVYTFDIVSDTAQLKRRYRVGLGDNPAGSDVGALTSPRMDFQNVVIFPDGRVATSFLDSTTFSHPPGTGMLGRITPALAIELDTTFDVSPTPTPDPTPPPAPDLQVTAMAGANQPPKEGDRVVVRATVTNAGDGAAGASTTELRLEDGTLIGTASTPGVAAGGSVEVQVAWDTHGVKGDQVITATADAGAAVAESREGNNLGRLTVSVKGNKVQNGSFEQPAEGGGAPESWQGSSTGAGETGYAEGGASDGSHAVTITGTGTSVALLGVPTWTSAPIAVAPGEVLTLVADVNCVGMSSAPTIGVVYLGPAGELLSTVTLLTGPLATSGFAALEKTFTVPTGVASVRLVLTGFSPTDVRTAGTVTFDDIGLYAN